MKKALINCSFGYFPNVDFSMYTEMKHFALLIDIPNGTNDIRPIIIHVLEDLGFELQERGKKRLQFTAQIISS